ncbi:hypothetical protein KDV90_08015 [Serratia marcescens]
MELNEERAVFTANEIGAAALVREKGNDDRSLFHLGAFLGRFAAESS